MCNNCIKVLYSTKHFALKTTSPLPWWALPVWYNWYPSMAHIPIWKEDEIWLGSTLSCFLTFLLIKKRVVNIPTVHGCTNYYDMMKRANIDSICKFNILSNKIMKLVHVVFFFETMIYMIYIPRIKLSNHIGNIYMILVYTYVKNKKQKPLKIKTKIIIYICKKFVKIRSLENFPMLLK